VPPNSPSFPATKEENHDEPDTQNVAGGGLPSRRAAGAGITAAQAEAERLVWCDHSVPSAQAVRRANGVKVNVKEFEGTGAGLAIVEQSQPGDWDVMVIDSIDVRRGVDKGLFAALPEDQLPIADLFPEVTMDATTKFDGKRYGITEKFGYNTISYNNTKADPADMTTLASLLGDKYKGRIAIYYYCGDGHSRHGDRQEDPELTEADLRDREVLRR
jgi:spermidine/putrescine transport system substrate-binding protein